jgi:hypothetical protein
MVLADLARILLDSDVVGEPGCEPSAAAAPILPPAVQDPLGIQQLVDSEYMILTCPFAPRSKAEIWPWLR